MKCLFVKKKKDVVGLNVKKLCTSLLFLTDVKIDALPHPSNMKKKKALGRNQDLWWGWCSPHMTSCFFFFIVCFFPTYEKEPTWWHTLSHSAILSKTTSIVSATYDQDFRMCSTQINIFYSIELMHPIHNTLPFSKIRMQTYHLAG